MKQGKQELIRQNNDKFEICPKKQPQNASKYPHEFILLNVQYVCSCKLVSFLWVLSSMMNKLINSVLHFSFSFFSMTTLFRKIIKNIINVFRVKSIFRLLFCTCAMTTATTRPSARKCKKKIQSRSNIVHENILNQEPRSSNISISTTTIQPLSAEKRLPVIKSNHKFPKIKIQTANYRWRSARAKLIELGHMSFFLAQALF